ncbi:MAG: galactokinase [bacterium]
MGTEADGIQKVFTDRFGGGDILTVRAPGRVNLIGEHTDYNDGFVLPMAILNGITMAGRKRDDRLLRLFSIDYNEEVTIDLGARFDKRPQRWSMYIDGVVRSFEEELGDELPGFDAVLTGDVPQGSGLSSSAALEVATGFMINEMLGLGVSRVEIALFGQKAENNYLGVRCGIMDQFASCLCAADSALFLDCRSLDFERVPLVMKNEAILILDTGKSRGLVDSAYNERRRACEDGVKLFAGWLPGTRALRDVSSEQYERYADRLPDEVRKRCRHIVYENERVLESVKCLKNGNLARFGELMWESHDSLRDDFEVSCAELDALNGIAHGLDGMLGERMTGAGFGGCAVALVKREAEQQARETLSAGYLDKTGRSLKIYGTGAADGARLI